LGHSEPSGPCLAGVHLGEAMVLAMLVSREEARQIAALIEAAA
jgi:hypothetical protein